MNQTDTNSALSPRRVDRWVFFAVVIFAVATAVQLFLWSWHHADQSWWSMVHDRHAHYTFGLNLAMDVKQADLSRLRHDLNALRTWGPLHGLLQGGVQLVFGPDHRYANLPSLAGWVLTICLAFLIARRMLPEYGTAAGLVVAAVLAALPGYRAYGTDVMLESLGVALTLLVLYWYLRAVQEQSTRSGAWLAISLITLFFHKYNYWLIVVVGLVLAEILRRPAVSWTTTRLLTTSTRIRTFLLREARSPFSWIALILFSLAILVWVTGGTTLTLGSRPMSVNEPHNLFTLGFLALFVRLYLWWRAEGRTFASHLDPVARPVLVWHGWATAIWFLIPKRLGYFLWFLSPANSDRPFDKTPLIDGGRFYFAALRDDYCVWPWEVIALLLLVAVAIVMVKRLRPGSLGVFTVFAVGALLAIQHTMTKNRFAHSWAAPAWVLGSVGLFALLASLSKTIGANIARSAVALVTVSVVGMHAPAWLAPANVEESGPSPSIVQPQRITDAYLPLLADSRHSQIVCNVPAKFFLNWTFIEAHRHTNFETEIRKYKESLEQNPTALRQWLETCKSDAIVLIEVKPKSPHAFEVDGEGIDLQALNQVLHHQDRFALMKEWDLPEGVHISLWKQQGRLFVRD